MKKKIKDLRAFVKNQRFFCILLRKTGVEKICTMSGLARGIRVPKEVAQLFFHGPKIDF
jgi:hypothetical protein